MKTYILIFVLFLISFNSFGRAGQLSTNKINQIADAVKRIENSEKWPYGIKSLKIKGNNQKERERYARQITINSIKNNYSRWEKTDKQLDFLTFFANRWCPKASDFSGNSNWIKNIHKIVK